MSRAARPGDPAIPWEIDETADVEVIPVQKLDEACERMLRSDAKYRSSLDVASLRSA